MLIVVTGSNPIWGTLYKIAKLLSVELKSLDSWQKLLKKMLNDVLENTARFMSLVPKTKRKKYGQFFTNETTAKFMASLFSFDLSKRKIEILDAGAGTGILAAAVI